MQRVKEINQSIWQWLNRATPEALYDRQLVWIALGLMLTGLVMVTSASFPISARLTDQPFHFMFRHAIFPCVGVNCIQRHITNSNETLVSVQYVLIGLIFLFAGRGIGCR